MRNDAILLEEARLEGINDITDYPWFKGKAQNLSSDI